MFNPYPWQKVPWQFLASELTQQRLTHALLMHGASGLGKRDFAIAFSAYVLCDQKNNTLACGQCQSCRWIQAGSHPDFYHVQLEEKSKSIKVDQLRSLTESLHKTSQRNGYQVAVIESADTMNRSAANALLKTLEEPPGDVLIILVADRMNTFPATIVSRCQYVGFCAAESETSIPWLQKQVNSDVNVSLLLKVAEYAPLRALEFLELGYFEVRDQLLRYLLDVQRHDAGPIAQSDEFAKKDLSLLLNILMSLISDVIRLQHGVQGETLSHSDRLVQLQALAKAHDVLKMHEYFQQCQKALASTQSGIHLNPQLLLEDLMIQYYRCCGK